MNRSVRFTVTLLGLVVLVATFAACKEEVESPTPTASALTPSIVCGEQITTEVDLSGAHLSPLPLDVLTDDPGLALPDLWLQRTTTLLGEPVDDPPVDLDESEQSGHVRWVSQDQMLFDIFPELALEPGLYDLYARNAGGHPVVLASALTIVERPTLTSIVPRIACGEQLDNTFDLTGTFFLVIEGRLPTVSIGEADLSPGEVRGCFDLPGPTTARACTGLTVTLPADTLEPGIVDVVVTNPAPAACLTTEAVQVEIVPPPSVTSIEPELACVEQSERVFIISGSDFLVLGQGTEQEYPSIEVGDVTVAPTAVDGCTTLAGPAAGRRCTELTIALPADSLDPGLQPVTVTNPQPAHCSSEEEVELEVVPPPTLTSVAPNLVCSEQHDNELVLTGTGFIVVPGPGDTEFLPSIHFGDELTLEAESADGCLLLPGTAGAQSCTSLTVTVEEEALAPDVYAVTVTNPDPAGCTSTEEVTIELIPPPTLSGIVPVLACLAQGGRSFTLQGTGFLVIDTPGTDHYPQVTVGEAVVSASGASSCTELSGPVAGRLCAELVFTLPQNAVDPGLHDVVVTNPEPADCSSSEPLQLETIAPPILDEVAPILACMEGAERVFTFVGTGFLVVEGEGEESDLYPTVSFGEVHVTATADNGDCASLSGTLSGRLCTGLVATLPAGSLDEGFHAVSVTNPPPAGCTSTQALEIEVVSPAQVTTVTPQLVCGDQFENSFTVTGTGFLVFDDGEGGELVPTIHLGDYAGEVTDLTGCGERIGSPFGGESCTGLSFTLPAAATTPGVFVARIVNPPPADCASTGDIEVQVLGAPVIQDVIPAGLCDNWSQTVTITLVGEGFLSVGDTAEDWPAVMIGTADHPVTGLADCVPLTGPVTGQLCGGLELTFEPGAEVAFGEPIVVTNPPIAACVTSAVEAPAIEQVPPPTITGFEPQPICDDASSFAVIGSDFQIGATVEVTKPEGGLVNIVRETVILGDPDPDRIEVITAGALSAGFYGLTVTNPDGCSDTETNFLEVVTGPFLFNIDPPVAYSEIRTLLTLYVASVSDEVLEVWIVEDETGDRTDLTFSYDPDVNENLVFAQIPPGVLAEGYYTVHILDNTHCPAFLEGSLYIEDDLTIAIDTIDPSFGWTLENTAIDITAIDPAPEGMVQFQDVPRVYLSPQYDEAMVATLLRSVSFRSPIRLTAIVPEGLPTGAYDVVVVNPDRSIGMADTPFIVTDADSPPPYIEEVSPTRVGASSDELLTIIGAHFHPDATVSFECLAPLATEPTTVAATNTTIDSGEELITAVLPAQTLGLLQGTICVVIVTQTATAAPDIELETTAEYSAVAIVSPSGNLFSTTPGPSLQLPRRSLAAASGRVTNVTRFLYAIGGYDPAPVVGEGIGPPTTYSTIEAVALDRFGRFETEGWQYLPHPVRLLELDGRVETPRTRSGSAQIGRFVFLAGGHDGTAAVDTVLRAQVLDPLAAPVFATLGLDIGHIGGLGPGTWIYRISAVFANDDLVNPGGESLPGDPIVIRVPDLNQQDDLSGNDNNGVYLNITWEPVDRAVAYRIYRSPAAGDPSGTETFLAEVVGTAYTEEGGATATDPEVTACSPGLADICPRRVGELGEWAVVATLPGEAAAASREASCVSTSVDPDDPDITYLYVGGGLDGTGSGRNTITIIPVTRISDDVQLVGTPFVSANTLDDARYECGGFSVGGWVYFGPGRTATSVSMNYEVGRAVGIGECSAVLDDCLTQGEADCLAVWESCIDGCAGVAECEANCDNNLASCENNYQTICGTLLTRCPGELMCNTTQLTLRLPLNPNNPFEPSPCLVSGTNRANAGYGAAATGNFLFMFGGGGDTLDNRIFEAQVTGPPELKTWTPSGSVQLLNAQRFQGVVQESGYIFVIGGEEASGVTGATLRTL